MFIILIAKNQLLASAEDVNRLGGNINAMRKIMKV
jgi:hypothetical protein